MENDGFYAVEEILAKKTSGKKTLYLVKWEGYGPDENTWEPLENVKKTVAYGDFLKKNPDEVAKSSPSAKKRRSTSARSSPVKRTRKSGLDKSAETEADAEPAPIKIKEDPAQSEEPEPPASLASTAVIGSSDEPSSEMVPAEPAASSSDANEEDADSAPEDAATDTAPALVEDKAKKAAAQEDASSQTPTEETDAPMSDINSQIDMAQMDKKQPDKNLIPECIWSLFTHKTSGKLYCLIKWKNAAERVQILSVDHVREHYPLMLIDFLLAERTSTK